ncbi:MAG: hypothetical protein IJN38_11275 [Clostridia bacterium]|nr:hypothetical protein [Clostridia bacterium]
MKNNKFRITAVIVLWLITIAVPFIIYNIPHESHSGGLVSEYEVEYKGDTYRCIDIHTAFSEYERKEKIRAGVMKTFWLIKDENGEEFIYVSQYGENFLCEKTAEKASVTILKIIVTTIILAMLSVLTTLFVCRIKKR